MERTDFFFDVDSTVISGESLQDMVALALEKLDPMKRAESEARLHEITNKGMNGDITFQESLSLRLALAPVHQEEMGTITERMQDEVTEGMKEYMSALRENGHGVWLLTAGLRPMMAPLAARLGIPTTNVLANEPIWKDGMLIGCAPHPLLTTEGKAHVIKELRSNGALQGRVVMTGDGASDLSTFTLGAADDFYGFGAHAVRPSVQQKAPHFFYSVSEMRAFVGI